MLFQWTTLIFPEFFLFPFWASNPPTCPKSSKRHSVHLSLLHFTPSILTSTHTISLPGTSKGISIGTTGPKLPSKGERLLPSPILPPLASYGGKHTEKPKRSHCSLPLPDFLVRKSQEEFVQIEFLISERDFWIIRNHQHLIAENPSLLHFHICLTMSEVRVGGKVFLLIIKIDVHVLALMKLIQSQAGNLYLWRVLKSYLLLQGIRCKGRYVTKKP